MSGIFLYALESKVKCVSATLQPLELRFLDLATNRYILEVKESRSEADFASALMTTQMGNKEDRDMLVGLVDS
jgi:hypothetical protein